jgi:putative transposase
MVREIHRVSKGTYGTRRMVEELEARGNSCGRSRARTLMNLAQVSVCRRRKFKATTDSRHNLPVAPNLLDREF